MSLSNETKNSCCALAPTRNRQRTNKCVKNVKWRKEEDELLCKLMINEERPNYAKFAEYFPGKTGQQVAERWDKVINPDLVKGSWTRQEDEIIINYVKEHGPKDWRNLRTVLPGRIGKQCRERWRNHLDPSLNHSPWTAEEDQKIIELHKQYGNHWVQISKMMVNRSDNSIKNRWNSTLKKQVLREKGSATENEEEFGFVKPLENEIESPVVESPMSTPKIMNLYNMNFPSPFGIGKNQMVSPFTKIVSCNKQNAKTLEENRIALMNMFLK